MARRLSVNDIVGVLQRVGNRYDSLDVFADDVQELHALSGGSATPGNPLVPLGPTLFRIGEGPFVLELIGSTGVARVSRASESTTGPVGAALIGGAIGAALGAAASKKSELTAIGLILGLLVGTALAGEGGGDAPRHVFALRFDPASGEWRAYNGGLLRWMKDELGGAAA